MNHLKARLMALLDKLRSRKASKKKPSEKWKKAGSAAATAVLVLAAVLCVYSIVEVQSYGYVDIFGYRLFRVVTGSMEPAIPTGALLISRQTDIEQIQAGDIVCFRSKDASTKGWIITHRVISKLETADGRVLLETKGDANTVADGSYVTENNLTGKVLWHTKEGNPVAAIISVLTSGMGFMACILLPCLLIAGLILSQSVRSIRREMAILSSELDKADAEDLQRKKLAAQARAYGLSLEEYEQMRQRILQELMAQRDEMLSMLRRELKRELHQGEQHEDQGVHGEPEVLENQGQAGETIE